MPNDWGYKCIDQMFKRQPPTVSQPPNVVYEVVRRYGYELGKKNPISVREKELGSATDPYYFRSRFSSESISEESLAGLLTRILQSLEELGIEIVQTPRIPPTFEFRKRQPEPPAESE